jgi:FkbM family methyltransferase
MIAEANDLDGKAQGGERRAEPGLQSQSSDAIDYRASRIGRRRSWYGLKKHAKRFLSLRVPNMFLRGLLHFRPALRQTGRLPVPARMKEVEGQIQSARFVMLRPDRCVVAKELYWGKGRRPKPEDNLALELFATFARRSDVMLDIGAYTGIFTLVGTAVNPDLEAHAFEIVPEVYRALFDNCVRNGVLHRTTLHHVGVGNPDSVMKVPARTAGSALPDFYSTGLHFDTGILVRLRSLDSLADLVPTGARVVVKVDVEGTENEVFRYGQEFLASFRPAILCEVLEGVAGVAELEDLLAPHGYRFYLVRDADLVPAAHIEPDADFRDWLFTKQGPDELAAIGLALAPRPAWKRQASNA